MIAVYRALIIRTSYHPIYTVQNVYDYIAPAISIAVAATVAAIVAAIDPCCYYSLNKCIGDDTLAAARQSLNCIKNKNKIKYGEKRFSIWRMEFFHPTVWHVALES